jgi:hypothetical protein
VPFAAQYEPIAQPESLAQLAGQIGPPPQTNGWQLGRPAEPAGRLVQVPFCIAPSDPAQTSQAPEQALLQQKPSEQKPLAHWVAPVQFCPVASLQAPAPSQVFGKVQVSRSNVPVTVVHVPGVAEQLLHMPEQDSLQQTPSLQKPEVH